VSKTEPEEGTSRSEFSGINQIPINETCVIPTIADMQKSEFVRKMSASHKWEVIHTDPQGEDGILSRVRCSVCGLGKIMILYDIEKACRAKWESGDSAMDTANRKE
jgi:hypothetical protein